MNPTVYLKMDSPAGRCRECRAKPPPRSVG